MATARKPKRPGSKPPGRVKKAITFPAELARLLEVYAASEGLDQSDVVVSALRPVLAGFYWARKGERDHAPTILPVGPTAA